MDILLQQIAGNGLTAALLAYFIYRNTKLTDRLFTVIENNTRAMEQLTKAQHERRREFKK